MRKPKFRTPLPPSYLVVMARSMAQDLANDISDIEADEIKKKIEAAGAKVEIK